MSSQYNTSGSKTFTAGEAITACRFVKADTNLDSEGLAKILMADSDNDDLVIGYCPDAIASGSKGTVILFGPTFKAEAGEAVDAGDPLYMGSNGTVVDTVNTSESPRLIALETVTASGDYVEVARVL